MRRTQVKPEIVQLLDVWPPVELSAEQIPAEQALQWAAQRIVELKACNVRFVRAMDTAKVGAAKLSSEFLKNLEFFGTADGYLTVALEMLKNGNCSFEQVSALVKAVSSLAGSLAEARKEMLSAMAETLQTVVLESESRASIGSQDVEEELAEINRYHAQTKRAKAPASAR